MGFFKKLLKKADEKPLSITQAAEAAPVVPPEEPQEIVLAEPPAGEPPALPEPAAPPPPQSQRAQALAGERQQVQAVWREMMNVRQQVLDDFERIQKLTASSTKKMILFRESQKNSKNRV